MKKSFFIFFIFVFSAQADDPYQAKSSVYKISAKHTVRTRVGTGVLIANNKILTNCHIVQRPGSVLSATNHITGRVFAVTHSYMLNFVDICVLEGNFSDGQPVHMSKNFIVGEKVWYYGYPSGNFVFGHGSIVKIVSTSESWRSILSSAFCLPGSSGGPLLNAQGELVGVIFASPAKDDQTHCLAIPAIDFWSSIRF